MLNALLRYAAKNLRKLPDPFCRLPEEWKQARLRREIKERIRGCGPRWSPSPKVFGIGLSRTVTTSLSIALDHLGYNSLHWKRKGKIPDWPEFFWADAATDTPCSAQFESLYYTFEKSKFIYTVRDVDSWRESIINHFEGVKSPRDLRHEEELRFIPQDPRWRFHNTIHRIQVHESLYAQHDAWEEAYRAFDKRVRDFFDDKPEDRFLEMNITEGDGWKPLCSFLGHEVPGRPFPHANARQSRF